jgi:hypothetical protein
MPTPKQMEKLAAEASRKPALPAGAPEEPLPAEYWQSVLQDPRALSGGLQTRQTPLSEIQRHVLRVSCRRCGVSSKSKRPMRSACMGRRRSGRSSDSDYWTIPASNGPVGTKRTAAGPRSSSRRHRRSVAQLLDVRMAPKHHPTPLSGGDRKALNKELGKARAMTGILAAQSAEMRGQGRDLAAAGRPAALRKLERTDVVRRRADRSVADHRPGDQRRLSMAGDPVLPVQNAERRRPGGDETPADHLRP